MAGHGNMVRHGFEMTYDQVYSIAHKSYQMITLQLTPEMTKIAFIDYLPPT